jgi:ribose transport system ATP-binding protein
MAVSLKKYFPFFFVNKEKMYGVAENYKNDLRIVAPNVLKTCKQLSGGNQQKVVLAKWLSAKTNILIFDEPTRGIDVGAKMEIYALMDRLATEGKAILMISSELPEVIGMSDRIYIMHEGTIVGETKRGESTADAIGSQMLGVGGVSNEE